MNKNNVYGGFSQALFFSGSVSIPRFLLDHYSDLGITDREMMLIIHIMTEVSSRDNHSEIDEQIMRKMSISVLEFSNMIKNLQSKGLITITYKSHGKTKQKYSLYDLKGLIDHLFELWGIDQFRQLEASENEEFNKFVKASSDPSILKITSIFEQELGRPLTGFECEHIEKWLLASYSEELILEALRRGVSAGIRSFRYLDSILREWEKKGIHTRLEVEAEDESFQLRQGQKGDKIRKKSKTSDKNSKYDDIYL